MLQKTSKGKCFFYGKEISEMRYGEILKIMKSKPPAKSTTTDYRLREDLTWEEYEVEPEEPDDTVTDAAKAEAYDILMGVES